MERADGSDVAGPFGAAGLIVALPDSEPGAGKHHDGEGSRGIRWTQDAADEVLQPAKRGLCFRRTFSALQTVPDTFLESRR